MKMIVFFLVHQQIHPRSASALCCIRRLPVRDFRLSSSDLTNPTLFFSFLLPIFP